MKFATQEFMDSPVPLDASRIVVVADDGRTAFEIVIGKDGHSVEFRGVDSYKFGDNVYINRLAIIPVVSNCITISSTEWQS